ncbi:MAG: DUF4468 domain-containing protein [Bacteroidales bacterium]
MKKLLFVLLLVMPLCILAQNKNKDKNEDVDISKYLSGAVPVIDGKVVFSNDINAPGLSKNQVYEVALEWLTNTLQENKNKSGIIYKDVNKGVVAGSSEQYLVFKSNAFSLDRTIVNYRIILTALDNKCNISMEGIRYLYNGAQKSVPDRYSAEEWITDEVTINKAGTKLYPISGKFRIKTVDLANDLTTSLRQDLEALIVKTAGTKTIQQTQIPVQATSVTATPITATAITATPITATSIQAQQIPATSMQQPTTTVAGTMEGYKNIAPDKIPGNIIKLLSEDWMLITAGNSTKFNTMTASWGGLGVLYNKPIAICFINPTRYTYQIMETGDTYTLTFYTETYREALNYCGSVSGRDTDKIKGSGLTPITTPNGSKAFSQAWMIIECRKLVSQSISLDAINSAVEKEKRGLQPMHKMYIGEILNVWVK